MADSAPPAARRAVVIRHVAFEDLDSFAEPLIQHGYGIEYVDAGLDDLYQPGLADSDLLVVLGGPISAVDDRQYPFLADEARLLERRLNADRPTLGICLGAQLMARALGSRVYGASAKEIGWGPLSLTEAGGASALRHLAPDKTSVLHWHGDTFDLPRGAVLLASTAVCENQAFLWGTRGLALQFHVEVTAGGLERWFIGHTLEIEATPGVSVEALRAATTRAAPLLEQQGQTFLRQWLAELGGHDRG